MIARKDLIGYGLAAATLALVGVAGHLRNVQTPAVSVEETAKPLTKVTPKKRPKNAPKAKPPLPVPAPRSLGPTPEWPVRRCDDKGWCWTYF